MSDKILNIKYRDDYREFKRIVRKYFKPGSTNIVSDVEGYDVFMPLTANGSDGWKIKARVDIDFVEYQHLITPKWEEILIKDDGFTWPDTFALGIFLFNPVDNLATRMRDYKRYLLDKTYRERMSNERTNEMGSVENAMNLLNKY